MSKITLLDGSIGQELVKRSGEKPTPLWSTMVMLDDTKLLSEVHDEYFSRWVQPLQQPTHILFLRID